MCGQRAQIEALFERGSRRIADIGNRPGRLEVAFQGRRGDARSGIEERSEERSRGGKSRVGLGNIHPKLRQLLLGPEDVVSRPLSFALSFVENLDRSIEQLAALPQLLQNVLTVQDLVERLLQPIDIAQQGLLSVHGSDGGSDSCALVE